MIVVVATFHNRQFMTPKNYGGPYYGHLDPSHERFEARKWLANNGCDSPLASNRFRQGKPEALAFVEDLYAMGAIQVLVTNIRAEQWRLDVHGGPYADKIVVILPENSEMRAKLFATFNSSYEEDSGIVPPKVLEMRAKATAAYNECFPERSGMAFKREDEEDVGQFELVFWWD